jgi:actin related protein 2/3 complex subunit 2
LCFHCVPLPKMAMILLKEGHRSLGETVDDLLQWQPSSFSDDDKKDQHRRAMKVELDDFDNVSYRVRIVKPNYDSMCVSANIPFFDDIAEHGADAELKKTYGAYLADSPEAGYNISLNVNFNDFSTEATQKKMKEDLENIKPNILGSVFHHFFDAVAAGKTCEKFMFDLRADTQVYFSPKADRVTVTFGVDFRDKFDKVLARIFLTEFQDAKRRRELGAAPPVSFDVNPTLEMQEFGITEATGNLGFISFAVLKTHVGTQAKRDKIVATLQGFRTYLQYHIKCSKSYFHMRMRKRCVDLLKVLNRAKVKPIVSNSTAVVVKMKAKGKSVS